MPDQTDSRPSARALDAGAARDLLTQVVDRLDRAGDSDGAAWLRGEIADRAAEPDRAGAHDDEPIPFVLTSHWYGATGSDIAPAEEHGLVGGEGPVLSSGPTLSAEEAAQALTDDGRSVEDAYAAVRRYQDATSERLGTPVHAWGLDAADLDAIRAEPAGGPPAVAPVIPLPRADSDQLARSGHDPGDVARRDQLTRWHTEDAAAGALLGAGPVRDRGQET